MLGRAQPRSAEEVGGVLHLVQVEGAGSWDLWEGQVRVAGDEVVVQARDQRGGVQVYELSTEDLAHAGGVGGVAPVGVVHACESDAFFVALESGELHVG